MNHFPKPHDGGLQGPIDPAHLLDRPTIPTRTDTKTHTEGQLAVTHICRCMRSLWWLCTCRDERCSCLGASARLVGNGRAEKDSFLVSRSPAKISFTAHHWSDNQRRSKKRFVSTSLLVYPLVCIITLCRQTQDALRCINSEYVKIYKVLFFPPKYPNTFAVLSFYTPQK